MWHVGFDKDLLVSLFDWLEKYLELCRRQRCSFRAVLSISKMKERNVRQKRKTYKFKLDATNDEMTLKNRKHEIYQSFEYYCVMCNLLQSIKQLRVDKNDRNDKRFKSSARENDVLSSNIQSCDRFR